MGATRVEQPHSRLGATSKAFLCSTATLRQRSAAHCAATLQTVIAGHHHLSALLTLQLTRLLRARSDVTGRHCISSSSLSSIHYACHMADARCAAMPLIVVRQRKPFRRKDGLIIYFEDNAGVIVNPKGEIKGACHVWAFLVTEALALCLSVFARTVPTSLVTREGDPRLTRGRESGRTLACFC